MVNVTLSGLCTCLTLKFTFHSTGTIMCNSQLLKCCGCTQGRLVNRILGTSSVHFPGNFDEKEHELCPGGEDQEIRRK